jgi:tetratricopeptide (TPR) repeat protein
MAEALQVLEPSQGRLGQFAPFCAALATVYGNLGRYHEAAVQARLALDLDPKQADYYLLAAIAYMAAGYRTFAFRARQQWLRSTPYGPLLADMRQLDQAHRASLEELHVRHRPRDAKAVEEAGYRLDEGRWALNQGQWAEALRHSRAAAALLPGWPPPRNNATVALYYMERYAEAITEAEAVLRECDPDNVHALSNLARCHLIAGDGARANEYGDRLARRLLPDPDSIIKAVEGLAILDRDADIDRIMGEASKKFDDPSTGAAQVLPAEVYVHWGIAAANLGRRKEALLLLRRAQKAGAQTPLLKDTLEALEQGRPGPGIADRFPQFHHTELIGREALDATLKLMKQEEKTGRRDERAWADLLRRYPQLPLVARKILYETPNAVGPMAHLLASMRTPAAVETLREFVGGQKGTQDERVQVLHIMQEAGILPPGAQVEMWIEGQHRPIQPILQEISDEFVPTYPQRAAELYEEALAAQRAGRADEAERLYEAMLKIAPNAKEAYNNLAFIYSQRGDVARADAYLDKALEIDPLYPFPRTGRSLQALARGDVEAAKKWLEPLHTVRQWHPLGFAVYQKAIARIAFEEKDYKAARQHLELARQFNEEDPEIEEMLARLTLLETIGGLSDRWQEMADAYRRRRQKARLPADPTLADCCGLLTKGDMAGICRVLALGSAYTRRKADLRQYLAERLADADLLARIVADLNAAERAALRDLLDHSGVMEWQAFANAHGDDLKESPYLEYGAQDRKTVMGRLRARGLLFEGTADGRLIVAIPRELRPLLREALP